MRTCNEGCAAAEFGPHLLAIRSDEPKMEVKMRAAAAMKEMIGLEMSPAGNRVMEALENSKVCSFVWC